jgi:dTDP-4-amino-4,6-dideoxygalactose transaminase
MFYPIDFHKHLKEIKYPNDVAEELSKQVLILPSYPDLTQREQAYIIEAVKDYVGKFDVL